MKATLNDIAQKVGVSKSLVSMYLNKHKLSVRIADETKKKIDYAVKTLNYQPSFTARALSNGKTKTIGMICGGIKNPYFACLVEDAMEEAAVYGYQLLLSLTRWIPEEEEKALENLLNRQIDGLICCIEPDPGTRAHELLENAAIPVLFLNRDEKKFQTVYSDLFPALKKAMKCFAAHGCRTVYGGFYKKSLWPAAFLKACGEYGLKPEFANIGIGEEKVVEFIRGIVGGERHGFVVNGYQAYSLLLRNFPRFPGYRPEMVIGVDDYTVLEDSEYIIGGIYTDSPGLIRMAVDRLIALLEHPEKSAGGGGHRKVNAVFLTKEKVMARQKALLADGIRIPFPNY